MKTYPYPSGDGKVSWVSTEWLAQHIDDKGIMILDVQPNIHDYIMGHIPNSIYLNEGLFRSAWKGLPAMYVPPESIKPVLDRTGLDPNKPTVIYSGAGRYSKCTAGLGDGLGEEPMMAYSLARFGHKQALHPRRRHRELEGGRPRAGPRSIRSARSPISMSRSRRTTSSPTTSSPST